MLKLYPEEAQDLSMFQTVFERLKNSVHTSYDELEIVLIESNYESDIHTPERYCVDVYGRDKEPDSEHGICMYYALEFMGWDKWLGMSIAPETLERFAEVEIIAHCLFEMTFTGFDGIEYNVDN